MLKDATAIIACLLALATVPLTASKGIDRAMLYSVPEDGNVSGHAYRNPYFGFEYPLLEDWVEDVNGPPPSATGYYSLVALKPRDALTATVLIAAQDNFFAQRRVTNARDFLDQTRRQLVPALPAEPSVQVKIAGQLFARLDYAGAGLHHVVFATEIRCHTVIFSITSRSVERIEAVIASLNNLSFIGQTERSPICVPDYATDDHIIHRVQPAAAGPRFSSVPTRIIIGANGEVEHVHAINSSVEQAASIQDALSQWRFQPYLLNGMPVAVETGLMVQFSAAK
jgi:Gram-negative bacterial TonB protein C-terminal